MSEEREWVLHILNWPSNFKVDEMTAEKAVARMKELEPWLAEFEVTVTDFEVDEWRLRSWPHMGNQVVKVEAWTDEFAADVMANKAVMERNDD